MAHPIRPPAVAGYFYPGDSRSLLAELDRCLPRAAEKRTKAVAVVVPHAGYKYSGAIAGEVYSRIEIPERVVVLSPNHTGEGLPYALMTEGAWRTPLGEARIDTKLARRFQNNCPLLEEDEAAHRAEHSLEVQIPFLQRLRPDFAFTPLTLSYVPFERCAELGRALAKTIREVPEPVLIVASSDLNHYQDQATTESKDFAAIRRVEALDPAGLYETVRKERISMCGIIPVTVALVAAKELGAKKAELVRHATSGDVTGDYKAVVGYAGLVIS
jgi:AmmeMemoRadiSam system protein B